MRFFISNRCLIEKFMVFIYLKPCCQRPSPSTSRIIIKNKIINGMNLGLDHDNHNSQFHHFFSEDHYKMSALINWFHTPDMTELIEGSVAQLVRLLVMKITGRQFNSHFATVLLLRNILYII